MSTTVQAPIHTETVICARQAIYMTKQVFPMSPYNTILQTYKASLDHVLFCQCTHMIEAKNLTLVVI
jgi:hypothetical protein